MSDRFEELYATDPVQPQLAPTEVLDRVAADERRLISAEYTGIMAQASIEEAMIAEFYKRAERLLGYRPSLLSEMKQEDIDFLAKSEGLEGGFKTLKEAGVAIVKHRVTLIVGREGLDLALTIREGLREALIKKHTAEVERERSKC